jgi:hypothetical protein
MQSSSLHFSHVQLETRASIMYQSFFLTYSGISSVQTNGVETGHAFKLFKQALNCALRYS